MPLLRCTHLFIINSTAIILVKKSCKTIEHLFIDFAINQTGYNKRKEIINLILQIKMYKIVYNSFNFCVLFTNCNFHENFTNNMELLIIQN